MHIPRETLGWHFVIKSKIPSTMRARPPRGYRKHNDKYIYKSVASLVQYISKDILSLQWPLSNEKGKLFQLVILRIRVIVIIVMIKHFSPKSEKRYLDINAVLTNLKPPPRKSPPDSDADALFFPFRGTTSTSTIKYLYTSVCNLMSTCK